jgi:hypothetical protein
MNETETQRIAAAINILRPDWPTASIKALLTKPELVNRPRRDVAVALVWVACESDTKTPGRVLAAGPWWQAASSDRAPEEGRRHNPPPAEECPNHPGEWRINCRPHAADRKAQRDELEAEHAERVRLTKQQAIDTAREAIREAARAIPAAPAPPQIRDGIQPTRTHQREKS